MQHQSSSSNKLPPPRAILLVDCDSACSNALDVRRRSPSSGSKSPDRSTLSVRCTSLDTGSRSLKTVLGALALSLLAPAPASNVCPACANSCLQAVTASSVVGKKKLLTSEPLGMWGFSCFCKFSSPNNFALTEWLTQHRRTLVTGSRATISFNNWAKSLVAVASIYDVRGRQVEGVKISSDRQGSSQTTRKNTRIPTS